MGTIRTQDVVARAIRVELARRGQSQRWLAEQLDERPAWLSRRMTGCPPFDTFDIDRVAKALHLPVYRLVADEDEAA